MGTPEPIAIGEECLMGTPEPIAIGEECLMGTNRKKRI